MIDKSEESTRFVKKIDKMLDRLVMSPHLRHDHVDVLIGLYALVTEFTSTEVERLLTFNEEKQRRRFFEEISSDVENIIGLQLICSLDKSLLTEIIKSILEDDLPNIDIATALLDVSISRNNKDFSRFMMNKEIAELCYMIASKDAQPKSVLCMGTAVNYIALNASRESEVLLDSSGIAWERRFRRSILKIAGSPVVLSDSESVNLNQSKTIYDSGILSDAWNSKNHENYYKNTIINDFDKVSSDVLSLYNMIKRVKGRVVCVVSPGWLFKTTTYDMELKKYLLDTGMLEAVIQLPSFVLSYTSVAPAVIVINTKVKINDVQFIDASGEKFFEATSRSFRKLINANKIVEIFGSKGESAFCEFKSSKELLKSADCNFDVKRYIKTERSKITDRALSKYKVDTLDNLVEIISCQSIKNEDSDQEFFLEINPVDIDENGDILPKSQLKEITPSEKQISRAIKQRLKAGDVILTVKGGIGKCTLIGKSHEGCIASQSFAILRTNEESPIDGITLFSFLRSELGDELIDRYAVGSSIKSIKMQDLKRMPIPIPTMQEQATLRQSYECVLNMIEKKKALEKEISESIKGFITE